MKYLKFRILLVLAAGCATVNSAEPRLEISRVTRTQTKFDLGEIEKGVLQFEDLTSRYLPSDWDPRAEPLFQSATKATAAMLSFDSTTLKARALVRDPSEGDILRAQWKVQIGSTMGTVTLNDTSEKSSYSFHFPSLSIDGLVELLPKLLTKMVQSRIYSKLIIEQIVREQIDEQEKAQFYYGVQLSPRPEIHEVRLQGLYRKGTWYVQLAMGKGLLEEFYGRNVYVKERAPALDQVVKSWSDQQIISEIFWYIPDRDRILVQELVRRNFTDQQLLELLTTDMSGLTLNQRLRQILEALQQKDPSGIESQRFARAALNRLEQLGPKASEAVWTVFRFACVDWVERTAVGLLKKGHFPEVALQQLTNCGSSEETRQALVDIRLNGELEKQRQSALKLIDQRIKQSKPQ